MQKRITASVSDSVSVALPTARGLYGAAVSRDAVQAETETILRGIQIRMAIHIPRQNLVLAICIAAAAVFLFGWVCPYLAIFGHQKLCIGLYILLLVIYVFGRANTRRPRRDEPKAKL
jgi:hypothetical protein